MKTKTTMLQILPLIGAICISQSNAQTSLQSFFETQGFQDRDSINGTYDLAFVASGLKLTIGGDGMYREATAPGAVNNSDERFGVWGPGDISFSFNQPTDLVLITDGRVRPGEITSWTGDGVLVNSFADDSNYSITSNSFQNITDDFFVEGDVSVVYTQASIFTVSLDGRTDQPIDMVADIVFGTPIPEPSSLLLLGLGGFALSVRRKR